MVALRTVVCRRLRVFYQSVCVDLQMWMPFAVGWRGYGVQYSRISREALPVLRSRMARSSAGDDRHYCAANSRLVQDAVDVAGPLARRARVVSPGRRAGRSCVRMVGRVLDTLGLADPALLRAYWNFLWDLNPPTYYSSPWSSGSPSKSSTAEEADAAAVYRFAPTKPARVNLV